MSRLLKELKPYRLSICCVLVLMFLQSLSTVYLPRLMSNIVDIGVLHGDISYILRVGLWMLIVSVGALICSAIAGWLASRVSAGFGRKLRQDIFATVEKFTLHEFDQIGTASLMTRTTNDISQVQQLVNMMLRMMVRAPLAAIGGIIMAFYTDVRLSVIVVIVMPILGLGIWAVYGRGIALFKAMQGKIDTLNRVVRENLTGIRVIRSFNRIDDEQRRFHDANFDLTDTATKVNQSMAALSPMIMLIMNLSTIAIIWFGGLRIYAGDMQVGSLMAFIQYVTQILFAIMMVSVVFFIIPRATASANRINEVLQTVPQILDPAGDDSAQVQRGCVEFQSVTFHYPGAEHPAISNVTFTASPNKVTAIIGGTGSGKTTMMNLVMRFYDTDEGNILLDGINIRDMTQQSLRSSIGFVPQKAVLFSGTIAQNIRYGRSDATDADVAKAAEIAQATDFIATLEEGFQSQVEQGGINLSGGQKQRISIARALVREPQVYIFDDSFSALDFKTEARLQSALQGVIGESTVLVVAQRVSTVKDADQIIVLDEGRVAGIGPHQSLMENCRVYREIVSSQLTEGETA